MSPLPLNNDTLRNWASGQFPFVFEDPHRITIVDDGETKTYVGVYGSGPFSTDEFQSFLESLDLYVVDLDEVTDFKGLTLIVGTVHWEAEILDGYLDRALAWANELHGHPVRIYSQEMFLFRLMAGIDPFDAPSEVLREFGRDHPALDHLANLGFDWPSCQAFPGRGGVFEPEAKWPKKSPLKLMGYKVGKNGIKNSQQRREILTRAFFFELPSVEPKQYMSEWGTPASSERLKKFANSLAAHTRNAKRSGAGMELAIEHWESDLVWLKQAFYTGRFQFQWPSTD